MAMRGRSSKGAELGERGIGSAAGVEVGAGGEAAAADD